MSKPAQDSSEFEEPGQVSPEKAANGSTDWQKLCQELAADRDKLRKELTEVTRDRDAYLKAVKALLPVPEYPICTKEELFAQVCHDPSFDNLIAELEKDMGQ